jgi:carboxylesterase type B
VVSEAEVVDYSYSSFSDCPQFLRDAVAGIKANGGAAAKNLPAGLLEFGAMLGAGLDNKFDEDCLTLNVWSKPQTGETNKAVLLWIYGGATSVGSSSAPYYNPARYAAEHDLVAVSIK